MTDLLTIVIMLLAASLVVTLLLQRIGAPTLIGYIFVGLLIGPTGIGLLEASPELELLAEIGVELPDDTEIKVWDSSGHSRWFVIPERPSGTDDFTDEQLMDLVTTESMMGVALAGQA